MDPHGEFDAGTSKREISLLQWVTKTIEAIGVDASNVNDSRKTRGQKQHGSVALMAHVLDACDLDTYANAHGQPKWDNAMDKKYNSFIKE
jgi:hypothetical protein